LPLLSIPTPPARSRALADITTRQTQGLRITSHTQRCQDFDREQGHSSRRRFSPDQRSYVPCLGVEDQRCL
jgi:hypothetical protein